MFRKYLHFDLSAELREGDRVMVLKNLKNIPFEWPFFRSRFSTSSLHYWNANSLSQLDLDPWSSHWLTTGNDRFSACYKNHAIFTTFPCWSFTSSSRLTRLYTRSILIVSVSEQKMSHFWRANYTSEHFLLFCGKSRSHAVARRRPIGSCVFDLW